MMVSPELIRASNAPSASPLNSCETKLAQLIIATAPQSTAAGDEPPAVPVPTRSGVAAELAPEGVRLLHQRLAGDDFDDLPEVLLVLHVPRRLAAHDHHRPHELVVLLAEIDLANRRLEL